MSPRECFLLPGFSKPAIVSSASLISELIFITQLFLLTTLGTMMTMFSWSLSMTILMSKHNEAHTWEALLSLPLPLSLALFLHEASCSSNSLRAPPLSRIRRSCVLNFATWRKRFWPSPESELGLDRYKNLKLEKRKLDQTQLINPCRPQDIGWRGRVEPEHCKEHCSLLSSWGPCQYALRPLA